MTYLILIEFYYFHLTYKENEAHRVLFAWVYQVAMFLKCFFSLLEFHSLLLISLSPIYSLRISSSTVASHLFFFCWKLSHSASLHVTIVFMCLQTGRFTRVRTGAYSFLKNHSCAHMKSETETKPANGDVRNRIWQESNVRQEIKAQKVAVEWVRCCCVNWSYREQY